MVLAALTWHLPAAMITIYGSIGMISIELRSGRQLYKPPAGMLCIFIEHGVPMRVMHYHLPGAGSMSYWRWETTGIFIKRSEMRVQMRNLKIIQRFFRAMIGRQRHLAVMMGGHERLGGESCLKTLPHDLVVAILTLK